MIEINCKIKGKVNQEQCTQCFNERKANGNTAFITRRQCVLEYANDIKAAQ